MPRLLLVTTVPGTIDVFLLPYARHFRALGWTVDALTSEVPARNERIREGFDRVHEVHWSRNPLDPRNLVVAGRQVQRCVAARCYDVVHVHTPVASFVTRFALRRRRDRVPQVVYTAHGFHFHSGGRALSNAAFIALERVAAHWTDYLVVMNHDDLEAARRYALVPPDRIVYMPGIGLDTATYAPESSAPEPSDVRRELGLDARGRYLLVVGAIDTGKRHVDAVSALARIAPRFPDVHLAFAGEGALEPEVRRLACSLGVAGKVHFLGFRRDVPSLLRSAAAVLLPSEREGLPRCLLEAMASGVPCVASDIRGSRDLLGGGCGLLFDVRDVTQLAEALTLLLSSSELSREIAGRAAEKVKLYDIRHLFSLHEQLYARALAEVAVVRRRGDRAA